jgi:hypothetical protein
VLPDVDADDRCVREERVLVLRRRDLELFGGRVEALERRRRSVGWEDERNGGQTHQPAPARALNGGGRGVELLLEGVKRAKRLLDRLLKRTFYANCWASVEEPRNEQESTHP